MLQLAKLRPRLGKTFIDRLTNDVILAIGNTKLTRSDLVGAHRPRLRAERVAARALARG